MTTLYTDHYSANQGATGHATTLITPSKIVDIGKKHSRIRRSAAFLTVPDATDLVDDDIIRIMDLKSGDRLIELFVSSDADWHTIATFNIGLYLKGAANDGAAVDEDLFAFEHDWVNEIARVDVFDQATTLDDWDRGKTLWEQAAIGDGSDTVDPQTTYTIAATATANITVVNAAVEMLFEAYYVAGD